MAGELYQPGTVVSSTGLPTLVVWVGTENDREGGRIGQLLTDEGYAVTTWREDSGSDRYVLAVHLINRAAFETPAEKAAVCRHLMALVKAPATKLTPPEPVWPPELREYRHGDGWAEYTVMVVCGNRVEDAKFVRNQHGWYCDSIGWEFRWSYPVPDGGPERDGEQQPSQTAREAAQNLLRKRCAGDIYFRILLDEFPPL